MTEVLMTDGTINMPALTERFPREIDPVDIDDAIAAQMGITKDQFLSFLFYRINDPDAADALFLDIAERATHKAIEKLEEVATEHCPNLTIVLRDLASIKEDGYVKTVARKTEQISQAADWMQSENAGYRYGALNLLRRHFQADTLDYLFVYPTYLSVASAEARAIEDLMPERWGMAQRELYESLRGKGVYVYTDLRRLNGLFRVIGMMRDIQETKYSSSEEEQEIINSGMMFRNHIANEWREYLHEVRIELSQRQMHHGQDI